MRFLGLLFFVPPLFFGNSLSLIITLLHDILFFPPRSYLILLIIYVFLSKPRVITWQPLFAKSPRVATHVFFDKRLQICFWIPIIDFFFVF